MLATCPQGSDSCALCYAELAADSDVTIQSIANVEVPKGKMLHLSMYDEEHLGAKRHICSPVKSEEKNFIMRPGLYTMLRLQMHYSVVA